MLEIHNISRSYTGSSQTHPVIDLVLFKEMILIEKGMEVYAEITKYKEIL